MFHPYRGALVLLLGLGLGSAAGAQELFVSSEANDRILRYNGATGAFIDTFVTGNSFWNPSSLTFGPDGNLYAPRRFFGDIQRYNGTTGALIDTFVPGFNGGLSGPTYLAFRIGPAAGAIPEPGSLVLLLTGAAGGVGVVLRRRGAA